MDHGLRVRCLLCGCCLLLLGACSVPCLGDTTGFTIAGTATSSQRVAGDVAWSNLGNITADDGSFVTASVASSGNTQSLYVSNFGFNIPGDARIDGIEIRVDGGTDAGGPGQVFEDQNVQIVVNGDETGIDRRNEAVDWDSTHHEETYGSATERFGIALRPETVNRSDFGVMLRWERNGVDSRTAQIDYVSINVHYTPGLGSHYDVDSPVAIAWITSREAIGTSRVYFPGLGTPSAVLVLTAGNPETFAPSDSSRIAIGGGTSASSRWWNMTAAEDNQSTWSQDAGRRMANTRILGISSSDGSNTVVISADHNGSGEDYVELDWTAVNSNESVRPYVMVIGFRANQAATNNQDGGTGLVDITSAGFEPELVLFSSGMETYDDATGHRGYGGIGLGGAHNPGTGDSDVQIGHTFSVWDCNAVSDTQSYGRLSTSRAHDNNNVEDVLRHYVDSVEAFDSSGFSTNFVTGSATDDGFGWLALDLPNSRVAVGTFTTPTTTGEADFTHANFSPVIPFKPHFLIFAGGKIATVDSNADDSANAEVFGVWAMSDLMEGSVSTAVENGVTPSNAHSTIAQALDINDGDGTALFDATFTKFIRGGMRANFTATDGTARKWFYIAIGSTPVRNEKFSPLGF